MPDVQATPLLIAMLIAGAVPSFVQSESAPVSETWQQFESAMTAGEEPILPDFSWAGYKYGSQAIPDVVGPVFDVTKFGAIADDELSDQQAIQRAIDGASAAGGGVVFFPRGKYLIQTEDDPVAPITINGNHVILRGEGAGEGGTVIHMVRHFEPANPDQMYSTPSMFQVHPMNTERRPLANVTGNARRETFSIEVDDVALLAPGMRVVLQLEDTIAVDEFFAPLAAQSHWERLFERGIQVYENHTIASIDGNVVRFLEPIRLNVSSEHAWNLVERDMLKGVGVEDICFLGGWNQDFVHHRSALDDGGWSAFRFDAVADGWVRRCTFLNWNVCLYMDDTSSFSILNVLMDGNRGHFGIHSRRGYGLLAGYCTDRAGHHHGPSVGYHAAGTVYWRNQMTPDQRIDSHSTQPYATLMDRVDGGILYGSGGPMVGLPHHMRWFTLWNFKHPTEPQQVYDFWREGEKEAFLLPIVVGIHGADVEFNESTLQIYESPGVPVSPESLYEAQLERRLGTLPPWVDEVRAEHERMMSMPLPPHPRI